MKFKRFICLVLTIVLSFSILSSHICANAYVAHTPAEAVAWAKSKQGQYLDYYKDQWYAQCVELVCYYYEYLGTSSPGGNAKDYATRKQPDGWKHIPYYSGFVAQPGDIAVWTYLADSNGHVAIVVSANQTSMTVVEQNGNARCVAIETYSYNSGTFFGVIRPGPNFTNCNHSYPSSSPYVCTKCNEWKTSSLKSTTNLSNVQYVITSNNAIDHTGPYGECKIVNKYSKDTIVTATQQVTNGHGSIWYKLSNGNYIWSDYVKKYSVSYTDISAGTYYIKNIATGTYLTVAQNKDVNTQDVLVWEKTTEAGMKMIISKTSTGYKIRPSVCTSRIINPYATTVASGVNVNIYNDENDSSQWWQFEKSGDYYVIRNVQNSSCVLSALNGIHSSVTANTYTGANTQKWVLEPVNTPTTYTLDVNGILDSKSNGWLSTDNGYATFDMYINGSLVKNDVNDYNDSHPAGTKYEIKDIKLHGLECYVGGRSGSLSGTINAATTIVLEFKSYHSWDAGTIVREPTETSIGVKLTKCLNCGETKEEILPATGHNYDVLIIDATCFEGAYELKACVNCGDTIKTLISEPTGHDMYLAEEKLATCESSGHILHKCRRCDESQMVILDTFDHRWDDGVQTKEPTATENGLITFTCLECEKTKTEMIPAAEYIPGDVNLDGKITAADARIALRAAAKLDTLTGIPFAAADMNKDNQIQASDARLILRKSAKLD